MKPIIELFDELIKAQNQNLISLSYRGRQLATWAELDGSKICFNDNVFTSEGVLTAGFSSFVYEVFFERQHAFIFRETDLYN